MITPAVLITACGTLIMSTSTRLGRVVDRVRHLSKRFEELSQPDQSLVLREERETFVFGQLELNMTRARLLQRALSALYLGVCFFIGASGAIGLLAAVGISSVWPPVALGLAGALLLFYASLLLIYEARLAISNLQDEFDYRLRLGAHFASERLREERRASRRRRPWLLGRGPDRNRI
jgi:hypothetical protein